MTAEDHEALTAELAALEGEGRRAMAARIKTAREWGDLKENSEYHDAKNDQAHLETKIVLLRAAFRGRRSSRPSPSQKGRRRGSDRRCAFATRRGASSASRSSASQAADPASGKISVESPVARALLGVKVGADANVVLPRGSRRYTVLSVE